MKKPFGSVIAVAVLAFAAFLVWKSPSALAAFFSDQRHLGAIAATILRLARGLGVPPRALIEELAWPESTDQPES